MMISINCLIYATNKSDNIPCREHKYKINNNNNNNKTTKIIKKYN